MTAPRVSSKLTAPFWAAFRRHSHDLLAIGYREALPRIRTEPDEETDITGYICSLSTRTMVYKAMCTGNLLSTFYADLSSSDYVTPFAIFHQRYATNPLPTWHRAQPGRKLALQRLNRHRQWRSFSE